LTPVDQPLYPPFKSQGGCALKKTFFLFALSLLFFTPARSVSARFVYVTAPDNQTLTAYSIEKNGALVLVPGSSIEIPIQPAILAVDRAGKFLFATRFVVGRHNGDVYVYWISNRGLLKPVTGSPFPVSLNPMGLTTNLKNNLLFVLGLDGVDISSVESYSVDGNGQLRSTPNSVFESPELSSAMGVDPTGSYLYITSAGFEGVGAYQIQPTGRLAPVPGQPFAQGGNLLDSVAFGSNSVYAGAIDDPQILEFGVGKTGALTYLPSPVVSTIPPGFQSSGTYPSPIAMVPDSLHRFLYVLTAEADGYGDVYGVDNNVSGFTIGASGELTRFPNFAIDYIDNPAQIVVDPNSNYLYITSATGIHGYAIQRDGTLTEVPGSPFPISVGSGGIIFQ
jgi:6-phosphogluconolactonase (cycloisomerase 2 family)